MTIYDILPTIWEKGLAHLETVERRVGIVLCEGAPLNFNFEGNGPLYLGGQAEVGWPAL